MSESWYRHGVHFRVMGKRPIGVIGHIMDGIRAVRHAFYDNHIREYQSELCNNFPTVTIVKRSIFQKAGGFGAVHGIIFMI